MNRTQPIVVHDSLDDRREIYELLHRLPPARRVQFMMWACSQSRGKRRKGLQPRVKRSTIDLIPLAARTDAWDEKLTVDCFIDLWNLSMNFALDFDLVLAKLVGMARRSV